MGSYKVGDKVELVNERPWTWNIDGEMDKYLGKIVVIEQINGTHFEFDGSENWAFNTRDIAKIKEEWQ